MAPLDDTTPATRFDSFDIYRTSYKKIGNHEIEVGILVPKNLRPGKHPLIVKFHGGGLVTGDWAFTDWIGAFFVPYIHRNNAIVVLPNYRLIPEHDGADILEDLSDFWTWFNKHSVDIFLISNTQTPSRHLDLDYDRVLVTGDSSGGYMALMSALAQPQGTIKAVLAQYPMTNYLRRKPNPALFATTASSPAPPTTSLDTHISSLVPGTVVSSATPPARSHLTNALMTEDRYLEFFGQDSKMWPINLIEDKAWIPPTWIVHPDADSAVDVEDSKLFLRKCEGKGEVRLEIRPGLEHGFDIDIKEDDEPWLAQGLDWVEERWLGRRYVNGAREQQDVVEGEDVPFGGTTCLR